MAAAVKFFSEVEKELIKEAIQVAEGNTSGEIRVHLEMHCPDSAFDRGLQLFDSLAMHNTNDRNGVLIYLAIKDKKFAIIGDEGINSVVSEDFWDETRDIMQANFKNKAFCKGLCEGIKMAGEQLNEHFPFKQDDKNELPDDLSFS